VFALAYVFGIYAMADGLANLAHYYYDPARHSRWSMLGGIASVAVGLVAVSWPGIVVAALVVAAALEAGCRRLLTEDLQHGQRIEGLRIENPFRT